MLQEILLSLASAGFFGSAPQATAAVSLAIAVPSKGNLVLNVSNPKPHEVTVDDIRGQLTTRGGLSCQIDGILNSPLTIPPKGTVSVNLRDLPASPISNCLAQPFGAKVKLGDLVESSPNRDAPCRSCGVSYTTTPNNMTVRTFVAAHYSEGESGDGVAIGETFLHFWNLVPAGLVAKFDQR